MDNFAFAGLDPLFLTNAKLIIKDLLQLEKVKQAPIELYKLYDHLLKFVEICGLVVAVESSSRSTRYTVDDGTGTIECVVWLDSVTIDSNKPLDLGTIVRVMGKVVTMRNEKQVIVFDLYSTQDPHQEITHFLQAIQLKKVYQQPVKMPFYIETHGNEILSQLDKDQDQAIDFSNPHNANNQQELEQLILQYLPSSEFSLTSFLDNIPSDTNLHQMLNNHRQTMKDMFEELLKKGLIVSVENKRGLYRKSADDLLPDTIIGIIHDVQTQRPQHYGGVRIDYIVTKVLEIPRYATLSKNKKRINQVLNELVEQSILYAAGDKGFRLLLDTK
ncbi:uncharacterized protein B0P05DRAFT_547786 [Gilbertella persicaria]|uniref:uncharacterized protein n=1 Tax=Gilbertella persicaria TaxID=101096 RepID=UPI00221F1EA9|nr:uncharacterized protein B0P05DRAFT_547786 [Gilbertella persicaria]KAI8074226.1 hypothetical protein B0P05DRAFT_547786 [Gilbertella persicaria]